MNTLRNHMKLHAVVAWTEGQVLEFKEVEVQSPKANEVLLKMVATGVCHTGVNAVFGDYLKRFFPSILRHEGGAIVANVVVIIVKKCSQIIKISIKVI